MEKYNRLTVIKQTEIIKYGKNTYYKVLAKCDCGKEKKFYLQHLKSGKIKSCGCYNSELVTQRNIDRINPNKEIKKYPRRHYLYDAWDNMIQRCYNKNHPSYHRYGGRGITVYEPWIKSSKLFIEYVLNNLGERPKGYSLDRSNNNLGYFPGNLRWADKSTQTKNQERNIK
jgi:hypothetical protein